MSENQTNVTEQQTNNEQVEKKEEKVGFFKKMKQKKAEFNEKHPKIAKVVTFTTGAGIGALGAMAVNAIVKGITNSDEDIIDVSYKDITDNNDN